MRIGILGDVHGNMEALEAVTTAMLEEGVDRVLQVGDLVGYGSEPAPCIDRIRELGSVVCRGNHDDAVIGCMDPMYFNHYARIAIEWTYDKITSDHIKYLQSLPYLIEDPDFSMAHGTLYKPEQFGYILSKTEAEQSFESQNTFISFVGHSHKPNFYYIESTGDEGHEITFVSPGLRRTERCAKVLVNVGSVGQPRDEDPKAAYAIYDVEKRWVAIRRVPYDWEKTRRKIIAAGLPQVLGDRLRLGV